MLSHNPEDLSIIEQQTLEIAKLKAELKNASDIIAKLELHIEMHG